MDKSGKVKYIDIMWIISIVVIIIGFFIMRTTTNPGTYWIGFLFFFVGIIMLLGKILKLY